eukprot:6129572-Alexandrium_andersonii.AAC.1
MRQRSASAFSYPGIGEYSAGSVSRLPRYARGAAAMPVGWPCDARNSSEAWRSRGSAGGGMEQVDRSTQRNVFGAVRLRTSCLKAHVGWAVAAW